jgi:voltage-gated potassium channel
MNKGGDPRDAQRTLFVAPSTDREEKPEAGLRRAAYEVIFEAETPAGKAFDVLLLIAIIMSVAAVLLESVEAVRAGAGAVLLAVEWTFTLLFTVEYIARLYSVRRPGRYAMSFFGVVDLLAILPTYLALVLPGAQTLLLIRAVRLLRVFRIFKLSRYMGAAGFLMAAVRNSREKIIVFVGVVVVIATTVGGLMYIIEGPEHGFTSIPRGMYWAIVTLTTVGYGDIHPVTPLGQAAASLVMILGYGIIAVPTGIISAEATRLGVSDGRSCAACGVTGHPADGAFCHRCGATLESTS